MPLFREFHDLCDLVKITVREYLKSHAISSVLLSTASENAKIKVAKKLISESECKCLTCNQKNDRK